jgi:chromate transporter
VLTLAAAAIAFATKVNPLWILLAGGCLGLAGVV